MGWIKYAVGALALGSLVYVGGPRLKGCLPEKPDKTVAGTAIDGPQGRLYVTGEVVRAIKRDIPNKLYRREVVDFDAVEEENETVWSIRILGSKNYTQQDLKRAADSLLDNEYYITVDWQEAQKFPNRRATRNGKMSTPVVVDAKNRIIYIDDVNSPFLNFDENQSRAARQGLPGNPDPSWRRHSFNRVPERYVEGRAMDGRREADHVTREELEWLREQLRAKGEESSEAMNRFTEASEDAYMNEWEVGTRERLEGSRESIEKRTGRMRSEMRDTLGGGR